MAVTVQKALADLQQPFSFAVMSDTHFVTRGFSQERDNRPLVAKDYLENVTYALAPMMDALRQQKPDFVMITGDIAETHEGHVEADLKAGLDFFRTSDIPLLFARGNLDDKNAYEAIILPHLKTILGWQPETAYYAFDVGSSRFVVLDSDSWTTEGVQHRWLIDLFADKSEDKPERVFLFGHHPIWPAARAFCSPPEFCRDLNAILSDFAVDAYFCGHSHNQNMVLHRTNGLPVLQCKGAMIGVSDEPPIGLDRVQALLIDHDDRLAFWPGYLENTAPGWFIVTVNVHQTTVEWHHLNRGVEAAVRWYRPGDIRSFWIMEQAPQERLIPTDLGRIRRAFLRFNAWHGGDDLQVFLNDDAVGKLPISDGFSPVRWELPNSVLLGLQMENRLHIASSDPGTCALGNLVLEVVLPGGRYVRTAPTGEIFSWSDVWQKWDYAKLQVLKLGKPIVTMLSF